MTEGQFQEKFIEERYNRFPNHVFVPFLNLKYSIGKFHRGRDFGMPDTVLDVVEFDESGNFHLRGQKKMKVLKYGMVGFLDNPRFNFKAKWQVLYPQSTHNHCKNTVF